MSDDGVFFFLGTGDRTCIVEPKVYELSVVYLLYVEGIAEGSGCDGHINGGRLILPLSWMQY